MRAQDRRRPAPVRARPPRSGARRIGNDQPLRPRGSAWPLWIVVILLVGVVAVLVVPNRLAIERYLNRPLNTLRIESDPGKVTEGEVTSLIAVYMGEGFFDIDVNEIKRSLESHPWIARAGVKRVWPSTLALVLGEEIPIARWGADALLNQYGEAIEPDPSTIDTSLPLLSGPEGSQVRMMEQYKALSQILFPAGHRLDELILTDRNSWELVVGGGVRIVAGRNDVRDRLKRFIGIYEKQFGNDIADIERIDLRYSNGFAVKSKQMPGVASR